MKNKQEFEDFLKCDMEKDYYYSISFINKINGKNNDTYYEIFINNTEEISNNTDDELETIIIERFIDYLQEHNINYDIEELYNNIIEYINVYDEKERIKEV